MFDILNNNSERSELRKFVQKADINELCNLMTERVCHLDAPKILDNILIGFSNSKNCETKRRQLVESVLRSLYKAKVHTNSVDAIINRIVKEFTQYGKTSLVHLVEFCLESLRNNEDDHTSWKDILPLLLETMKEDKFIGYKGSEVSGTEYKSLIVKSIIDSNWDPKISTSLAKMFREMSLEKNDLETVMRALCHVLPKSDPNEIPPLVHQLLRLGNDSRLLFNTLYRYFHQKYSEADAHENSESSNIIGEISSKELITVESTVLYHIVMAVQMDHKIMKDFLRYLKSVTNTPEFVLDPFIISVLLLNVSMFEDQILDVLKLAVIRRIQDEEKSKKSAWLRKTLTYDWRIIDVLLKVVEYSAQDRYQIVECLVDFASTLMSVEKRMSHEEVLLAELGVKIIQKVAQRVDISGKYILQLLSEKILISSCSVSQYTDCLAFLCQKLTMTVLDNKILVVGLLEQLLSIPGGVAMQVLYAILPITKISNSIRDTVVLVLRKALTTRDTYTRQMAVLGFLQLLKNLKVSSLCALSQGNSSSTTSTSTSSVLTEATLEKEMRNVTQDPQYNLSLCQELLSILRRCFIYDYRVRLCLYEGLYDAITVNSELAEFVTEMLLERFKLFYEPDENIVPPVIFDKCTITQGAEEILQEPLGELIFLIQKIYIKTASKNYAAVHEFSMILESFCRRTSRTEAEHLNLNETTDLLDNLPKSQKALHRLKLTISICEALIAYRFGAWSVDSVHFAENVVSLFKSYIRFVDFLKRSNKAKKGDTKSKADKDVTDKSFRKTTRAATLKLPNTVIDLDTAFKMLSLLYDKNGVSWATKEQAEILRKRTEFHHYVLQTCLNLFCNAKSMKGADLKRHKQQYSKNYLQIGGFLFKNVISDLDSIRNFDEPTAAFALECFKELCDLMCNSLGSEFQKFLNVTGGVHKKEGANSQIEALLRPLTVMFVNAVEEEESEDLNVKKIPLHLIETISHLVHKVPFQNNIKEDKIQVWLQKETATKHFEPSVSLVIMQLLLFVEEQTAEYGTILKEVCEDLSEKYSEESDSAVGAFKIINERTIPQIYSSINNAIKCKLNNAVWLFGRLKAEQIIISTPGMEEETRRQELKNKERYLCNILAYIVGLLALFVDTKSDPGPHTDAVLKNVQQVFNILSNLTKYYMSKSSTQNVAFESTKFKMLVESAGKSLKPKVEDFISEIEEYKNKDQNKSSDSCARRNKSLRETKVIPRVIYEIEQFNKDILTLSKKSGIELNKYVKHSKTRDFKINKMQLVENLDGINMSMLTTQNTMNNCTRTEDPDVSERSERSSDSENGATPSKRHRENSAYDS
ncbi:Fanconi anemia group I protein isoform X2 [Belonocnema kinseyi]|uniref:Fanconi anemia group I protein isoform X2 n=1 Tax=Belonocnema kinseyi TaxID=2817044 RepID=UPI00143DB7EE|nr:Fanconi anemia group I protein isoform X2 [Belonocnema kinseyi]